MLGVVIKEGHKRGE